MPSSCEIRLPLLLAFIGAVVGSLGGQFVRALISALGLAALAYIVKNLIALFQRTSTAGDQAKLAETDGTGSSAIEKSSDWLEKWEEHIRYSPSYKGTPGNIWSGPKWASDD